MASAGNVDIVNGNLKLILGLIWSLIVHYQIGRSKFPPKKLMLGWLKAAVPDCKVNNFTTDWNSGIALSALLDYCEPGLFPHWKYLNPNDREENCRTAMELARTHFNIPMVLEPAYLASPHLDELSGMTYLSYFMREHSAGFRSTLAWVNSQLKDHTVSNFTTDWNDGRALCSLVKSLGASAKYQPSSDPTIWEANLERGIAAGKRLGVEPILRAKDMADQHVEHLGVMAYAASFQWVKPRINPGLSVAVSYDAHTTRIYQPTNFKIDFLSGEIDTKDITAEIRGPEATKLECRLTLNQDGGTGTFTPVQIGMHRVSIMCEGEEVKGSPFYIRAMPQLSAITHTGLDPCAVGSIVEVLVNSNGAKAGLVEVEAMSPTGRTLPCPVNERGGLYSATFQPDEAGEWSISVLHAGQLIQGGPFTCFVFDPHGVQLRGLDKPAYPESIFNFTIDARATGGLGNIVIDIVHGKKSLPHTIESLGGALYKVSLHTYQPGKYRVYVYFNGNTVKGSPFPLRVGTRDQIQKEREKHHSYKSSKVDKSSSFDKYDRYYDSKFDKSINDSKFDSKFDKFDSSSKFERSSGFDSHNSFESKFEKQFTTSSSLLNGFHESSPSPTRFSPLHNTSSTSPNYFRTITSPVQSSHHSTSHNLKVPVNGYSYRTANDGSPLNSPPLVRNSPLSPLHSPISHSSFTFNTQNHVIDTSNNVRVSTKSSSSNSKNSWDFLGNKSNSLFDTGSLIAGDALQLMPVHRNSTLSLNSEAPLSQINVTVTSPSKINVPVRLSRSLDGTKIHFTPTEIGEHYIDVKIYDTRITGSPFRSHAYNAQAIKVAPIPDGVVGQPVEFEIDGSEAGSGNLEILVNGGHVTSFVRNLGNQRFLASFVPHESRIHLIDMKFNGESCPGSPWSVAVMTGSGLGPKMSVIGESVRLVPVNQTSVFQISALGFHRDDIQATVISPSKRPLACHIYPEGSGASGIYRVEFTPTEVGSHVLDVTLAGDKLQGGPLVAKAYNSALIKVSDVSSGIVGQPCQFKVDASDAGEGQLEISVNEGEVPNHVTVIGGGKCLVSFTPQHSKPHIIDIKFNGETVEGCPLLYSISDMSRVHVNLTHLQLIPVSEVATFHMNVDSNTSAQLSVSVTGPTLEIPVKVTGNVHEGFTAEFSPQEVGAHNICVDYNGHPVYGTPFTAKVYDARKVHVGSIPQGHVGNTLQFSVDASQAGEGNLEITISARGTNIPTQVHSHGNAKFSVSFVPIEPLDHVISIQFNKEHVPGSPFMAPVVGDFPLVTGAALSAAPVATTSHFTLSNVAPGNLDDVEVNVEAPNGQSIPAQVKDVGGSNFKIEFTPKLVGEHKININYGGVPVTGSPYSCKVYDVNAIRVKPVERGIVGHPVTFIVETSQAGPGNLEVTVNGGRVATTAQAQGPHTYAISFTPRSAHTHTVDLRFNSHDVPGSPFTCDVLEAARVILSSEDKVSVHRTTRFIIETPHPPSATHPTAPPTVQVLSPSRQSVPVNVTATDNAGRYAATFTPTSVGDHSVEVKLGDSQVEGSPFLVKAYDTSKVRVTDINTGVVGKPVYFSINASQAGAGNLEIIVSVNDCNVPNYVQSEGNAKFRVNFKPKEAAEHNLSVRFNGEPIPGSPFQCKILEPGQVVVGGPGIKSAPVNVPAKITVDLPSPSNECSISVVAPSGRTILTNVGKQDNHVTAQYVPTEIGRYTVNIEVDGHHVRDSPFICNVYNVNNIKVTGLGSAKVSSMLKYLRKRKNKKKRRKKQV
ncbi:hypothetical protein M8J77_019933 [Diaphorina citri]|nr:hypothetical protein M8J77_019933 [Diaphorina citri]